ncbi:MAG: flagellar basal body rod protein FlgB [Pseudolabrys sp.]
MLRTRLQWHQARQRVLAENVANSDTANFRPKDLVAPKFEPSRMAMAATVTNVALAQTTSGHIHGFGQSASSFKTESRSNYETRPTGNAVSLEDEMMKVASNQMDYQAATALYARSLNLLKTALGKR